MLSSFIRRSDYLQITEIPRFDVLKQVHVLLTYHAVLDAVNKQFIVCKHVFNSLAVKITTPFEVWVIVT